MKSLIQVFQLTILVSFVFSCAKQEPEDPELDIGYFNKLKVQGGVHVYLVNGTSNKVISTTLDETSFHEQGDNTLFIQDGAGSVTISVLDLSYIWCEGCIIHVENQLTLPYLDLDIYGGDLEISNLTLDSLDIYMSGTAFPEIAGTCTKADLYMGGGVSLSAYDFVCDTLELSTFSENAEVHATSFLKVFVNGGGNTIYKGSPDSVYVGGLGPGTVTPF